MNKLIARVMDLIKRSYSPYSRFPVAAVLELKDGRTFDGVNIENAAFGLSNCAERSALFAAYSAGVRQADISRIYVSTDRDYFVSPCGSCRQVMTELMEPEAEIILVNNKGETKTILNKELLPHGFSQADL